MSEEAKPLNWRDYIDKRMLVQEFNGKVDETYEYTVMEVSPSGTRVKFKNAGGRMFWAAREQYIPVEVLP